MPSSSTRPSLRTVLVFAIAGPLLVGMLGSSALWLRTSRASLESLAELLAEEITASAEERLRASLDVPHAINQGNADGLLAGVLPLADPATLEPHFFRQLRTWPTASYVQLGRTDGSFVGVERLEGGQFAAETTLVPIGDAPPVGKAVFPLTASGTRTGEQGELVRGYDATVRPWYRAAVEAGEPTWSEIYQFSSRDSVRLGITAVQPVQRGEELLGVVGTDITLSHLSALLVSPRLGADGRVFVVEPDGTLVAASGVEHPFTVGSDNRAVRMQAADAPDRWTAAAATQLGAASVVSEGEQAFLRSQTLRDGRGIEWTIAVVLPEEQLLHSIRARTGTSVWLTILTAALGALLAMFLAHRVGRPIQALSAAATAVRDGEWEGEVPDGQTREVSELSTSFEAMRRRLQAKEAALQRTVETRTAALEVAREADRAKSAFLANMSHELRTPLNAILGYGEIVAEDLPEGQQREDVERILFSGRHLLTLIDQILDLARVEAGKLKLNREELLVDELVAEVIGIASPLAEEGGNTLRRGPISGASHLVTDRARVRQVLLNLVSNSAKFTQDGVIEIGVKREGKGLALTVEDTGTGIDEAHLERIFDAFAQVDEGATREHGGTGLGLAISRRLAEALGGSLSVRSTPGEGSSFTLWLPLAPSGG